MPHINHRRGETRRSVASYPYTNAACARVAQDARNAVQRREALALVSAARSGRFDSRFDAGASFAFGDWCHRCDCYEGQCEWHANSVDSESTVVLLSSSYPACRVRG